MRINVKVKTNARENKVELGVDSIYHISVTSSPIDNKANGAIIKILSKYFDRPSTHIVIVRGKSSKQKVLEID